MVLVGLQAPLIAVTSQSSYSDTLSSWTSLRLAGGQACMAAGRMPMRSGDGGRDHAGRGNRVSAGGQAAMGHTRRAGDAGRGTELADGRAAGGARRVKGTGEARDLGQWRTLVQPPER